MAWREAALDRILDLWSCYQHPYCRPLRCHPLQWSQRASADPFTLLRRLHGLDSCLGVAMRR